MKAVYEHLPIHEQLEQLTEEVELGNAAEPLLFELPDGDLGRIRARIDKDGPTFDYRPHTIDSLNPVLRRWVEPVVFKKNDAEAQPALSRLLVKAYLDTGDWPGVPKVRGAVAAPLVRGDLSVRYEPGFDQESGVYVADGRKRLENEFADARAAASWLLSWFEPFALEHRESRADCLALALTPLLMTYTRGLGDVNVPAGMFTANEQASGKTELALLIATMASSVREKPTANALPASPRETLNQVVSILKSGRAVAVIDNVKTQLDSAEFEALLTSRRIETRAFHRQADISLRNDTLWEFTSNTPHLSVDMLRRVLVVPLLKRNSSAVWDPLVTAKALREGDRLTAALVTMIESWAAAGAPMGTSLLSGFEVWSGVVSGILEHVGVQGFLLGHERAKTGAVHTDSDDEGQMVDRLARIMGGSTRWTSGELWDTVNSFDYASALSGDIQAVRSWLDVRSGAQNPAMSVGRRLAQVVRRDYIGRAWRLERVTDSAGHNFYVCEETNPRVGNVLDQAIIDDVI